MWQWNDGTMELYHYGVKGMKWGVRKARPQGDTTGMVRRKQNASSELRELQGYAKHPSKLGGSRVSTAIRNHQIKTLQKKAEINKNIKDYRKKYDSASAQSDHADALWKDAISIMPLAEIVLSAFSQRFRTNLRQQKSIILLSTRRIPHLIAPMPHGRKAKRLMPRLERMPFRE